MADYSGAGLEFPNNPADNDTYTNTNTNTVYVYSASTDAWTGPIKTAIVNEAAPFPDQVSASPAFVSGSGSQSDPYVISPAVCATQGTAIRSEQVITITGQTAGYRIQFTDLSENAGIRFTQPDSAVFPNGTWGGRLFYNDNPDSAIDGTQYVGLLQIGMTFIQWTVTQQVTNQITQSVPTSISVFSNEWKAGNVATLYPGTIVGGQPPYNYTYKWQRSNNVTGYVDIPGATQLNYTLQNSDVGRFVRGVTVATDNTSPTPQTLDLASTNSNTQVIGPPTLSSVTLIDNNTSPFRFTRQTFSTFVGFTHKGTGGSTQYVKFKLQNGDSVSWAVVNAAGQVLDIVMNEPGYVELYNQQSLTISFPEQFLPSGYTPDMMLPEGTTIQVFVKAQNDYGFDTGESIRVTPEAVNVVTYPKPDFIRGFLQYQYYFEPSQTPFNYPVPAGTYNNLYSFIWNDNATEIEFEPAWDHGGITQMQVGGSENAVYITVAWTDEDNNYTFNNVLNTAFWADPQAVTPPAKIKKITIVTDDVDNTVNGIVGFYDDNLQSVLYDPLTPAQTNLKHIARLEAADRFAHLSAMNAAQDANVRAFKDALTTGTAGNYSSDAYIQPKAEYHNGYYLFLNLKETKGNMDVSISVNFTNSTSAVINASGVAPNDSHSTFVTNLVAALSSNANVTPSVVDGALKLTPATNLVISNVSISVSNNGVTNTKSASVDDGTRVYEVTVAAKTSSGPKYNVGSSNAYYLDGVENPALTVTAGQIIRFNQDDSTNATHPLRLYTDEAKTTAYTTGVVTSGTAGSAGAHTTLTVSASTPTTLYYQCSNHAYMGNSITKS